MKNWKQRLFHVVKSEAFPKVYLHGIMLLSFLLFAMGLFLWGKYLRSGFYLCFEQAVQTVYAAAATASVALFGYPVFLRPSELKK